MFQLAVMAIHEQFDVSLYPLLGRVDPAAVDAMRPSPAEVKETFLVPVDFFRDHPPRVYSYELVPQVGDDFPYALVGAQKRYGWHRGRMDVPIYLWQGRAIWGMTGRIVRGLLEGMERT